MNPIRLTRNIVRTASIAALLALSASARADVKPAPLFNDHMVLQQDAPVPIWGTATADEKVTVKIGDQQASATAGADGKWNVKIGPLKTGGPLEMTIAGKNSLTIKDVLVGEVWVCSGQSNMGMQLGGVKDKAKELAEAKHPQIRMFSVRQAAVDEPASSVTGSWVVCSPETVSGFSAAAYFFGRDLHEALKQPIGLINSSWGGTRIEPWISPQSLENCPITKEEFAKFKAQPLTPADQTDAYFKAVQKYRLDSAEAKKLGKPAPTPAPVKPEGRLNGQPGYGRLYNGMIAPLVPYAIRGAIWYQGESNGGEGIKYRTWLPELINDWRTHWNQPGAAHDFPFLVVQLPDNGPASKSGAENVGWTLIREAEMKTADKLVNVGTAVTIDTSADGDLHPPEKQPVGHRLALIAEHRVYGMKDVVSSGPVYDSAKQEDGKLRITFKETHGGLVAGGEKLGEAPTGKLVGFYVAGEDKKFVLADATIDGDSVVLHSAEVAKPVAARYAWAQHPQCNLYNKANLPASPFRTDDWDTAAPAVPVKRNAK